MTNETDNTEPTAAASALAALCWGLFVLWQTPLPAGVDTKPGSATLPFPGIDPEVLTEAGDPAVPPDGGFLVVKRPWPGMLRGIWGDNARYKKTYWSQFKDTYLAGDGARHRRNRQIERLEHRAPDPRQCSRRDQRCRCRRRRQFC